MRVAATLDHPAIVRLLDSVEDNDYIYVVFELVRGDDLARAFREGMLDDAAVMRAVAAVCDALAHAHERGVVHRDIKPGNVLLREDGILKLTDFGIALVSDPDATVDDRLLGTLSYMAPEQALGENVDGAADIFSSALMLYEALAGANPFRAKTPQELADRHAATALSLTADRPDLPPVVLRHIDRALQRDPKKRPTAPQLRDALLHGARALERGMLEDEPELELAEDRERRLRKTARAKTWIRAALPRRRPRLRVVPDPADAAPSLIQRFVAATSAEVDGDRRAALARAGAAALTGVSTVALLGALPFYPVYTPLLLGIGLGVLALRHPLIAAATALLLAIPLAGNLSLGLVPAVAAAALVWIAVTFRAPRRAWLPVLAPIAAFAALWPLYLVACATAPRAHIRFVTGAAGPLDDHPGLRAGRNPVAAVGRRTGGRPVRAHRRVGVDHPRHRRRADGGRHRRRRAGDRVGCTGPVRPAAAALHRCAAALVRRRLARSRVRRDGSRAHAGRPRAGPRRPLGGRCRSGGYTPRAPIGGPGSGGHAGRSFLRWGSCAA